MLDRRAQIGGLYARHEGEDRLEIVKRDLDRCDRRGPVLGKGRRDLGHLGKGRMRGQNVEACEPPVPVAHAARPEGEDELASGARGVLQRARRKLRREVLRSMEEDSIVQRAMTPRQRERIEQTLQQLSAEVSTEPEVRTMRKRGTLLD